MKPATQRILDEASHLSPIDRAELVERIIESFDAEPDESILKAWETEAERRLADYKNGKAAVESEEEGLFSIS